jgi:hypothetical protein
MVSFTVPFLIAWRPSARADLMVGEYRYTTGLHLADADRFPAGGRAFVAALVSLAVRHRRASGEGRHQIRWVAMGGIVVMAAHLLWLVAIVDFELAERLARAGVLVSVPVLVASYAVAILRYRLYDIDVVISRSLVVAVLAGFIASVYIAVVVGVGRLVGVGDEASLGLKVVATAIVAVAFQPLRERVRRWADRVVYGHRATPYEVLAGSHGRRPARGTRPACSGSPRCWRRGPGRSPRRCGCGWVTRCVRWPPAGTARSRTARPGAADAAGGRWGAARRCRRRWWSRCATTVSCWVRCR